MWIGALLLEVRARSDRRSIGDADVTRGGHVAIRVLREQHVVPGLSLRFPAAVEPGDTRGHAFYFDRRFFDRPADDDRASPPRGLELASGISGHLRLDLELDGPATWPIDQVRVHVREYRRTLSTTERITWELDPDWRHIGSFAVGDHGAPLTLAFLTRR